MTNNHESILFEDIYLSLKQDILWLRLKPREFLTESFLAEKFETSKTPVRQALLRLSYDGLVTVFPRRGYCVSEISLDDIQEMHEYRYILENTCLLKAIERIHADELAHLDSLSYKDRLYYENEPPRFAKKPEKVERDSQFHIYLAELGGNRIIYEQLVKTLEKLQRLMLCAAEEEYMTKGLDEHHQLVLLIRDKKTKAAQELLHHHINEVYEHCADLNNINKIF
ncbi:MAG: GntR family transcriptional regulator [Cloacibacillus sp.]